MKHQKRGSFFTFIFSFLPGAAEMYMGFMKNGFSLMVIFFLISGILCTFEIGLLMFIVFVIWAYGFFHARNLAKMNSEAIEQLEDRYIWEELLPEGAIKTPTSKVRKWTAIGLIVIGVCMIWNYVEKMVYALIPDESWDIVYSVLNKVPQVVLALAIIVGGILMIRGKKTEVEDDVQVVSEPLIGIEAKEETNGADNKNA